VNRLHSLSTPDLYPQVWEWEAQERPSVCDGKGEICAS